MKVPKESLEPLKAGRPPTGELRRCLLCGVEVYVRKYQIEEGIGFYCGPCGHKVAMIERTMKCPACGSKLAWDEREKELTCFVCSRTYVDFPKVVVAVTIGAWDKIVRTEEKLRPIVAAATELQALMKTVAEPGPDHETIIPGSRKKSKPYKRRKPGRPSSHEK